MPVLTFGKHAGKDLAEIPQDYLAWLIEERKKEIREYEDELARRTSTEGRKEWMEKIVRTGYRTLARTLHPDLIGSSGQFLALSQAKEELERRIL
jgi:hypothetical protein